MKLTILALNFAIFACGATKYRLATLAGEIDDPRIAENRPLGVERARADPPPSGTPRHLATSAEAVDRGLTMRSSDWYCSPEPGEQISSLKRITNPRSKVLRLVLKHEARST